MPEKVIFWALVLQLPLYPHPYFDEANIKVKSDCPRAFNAAPEISAFMACFLKEYSIEAAVETGTWNGSTAQFFGLFLDEVHTIEINQETYDKACRLLANQTHVHCYLGSSEKILKQILPSLTSKKTFFYLDAHWLESWPLLQEIEEISKSHKDNCAIAIDDFKIPNRPDIGYDCYGGHECSYEYIKNKLDLVYSSYVYCYLLPNQTGGAKFLAIPKSWT